MKIICTEGETIDRENVQWQIKCYNGGLKICTERGKAIDSKTLYVCTLYLSINAKQSGIW